MTSDSDASHKYRFVVFQGISRENRAGRPARWGYILFHSAGRRSATLRWPLALPPMAAPTAEALIAACAGSCEASRRRKKKAYAKALLADVWASPLWDAYQTP